MNVEDVMEAPPPRKLLQMILWFSASLFFFPLMYRFKFVLTNVSSAPTVLLALCLYS